jgi:hypothetical protein
MGSTSRVTTASVTAFALCAAIGCAAPARVVAPAPAIPPSQVAVQRTAYPAIDASVVMPNFAITQIDAPYSAADRTRAREYFTVAVPNMVQESLAAHGVFAEVTRVAELGPTKADFVLQGQYGHIERLRGKELQPDEKLVRGDLEVWLVDVRSGKEVFRHLYSEEQKLPKVLNAGAQQLEPEYITRIATDLKGDSQRLAGFVRRPEAVAVTKEPVVDDEPVVEERPVEPPRRTPVRTASPRPRAVEAAPAAAPRPVKTAPAAAPRAVETEPAAAPVVTPVAVERTVPVAAERTAPTAARRTPPAAPAPSVAPPPSGDEDVEDWAIRMRRGLTEPTP